MSSVSLSPEFKLPTGSDYDDVIADMQHDVEQEGGARYFMGTITEGRIMSTLMRHKVILPLTQRAFLYEDSRLEGSPPNTNLKISRAVLSGMLFGHVINEATHPNMYEISPYEQNLRLNEHFMTDAQRAFFREQATSPRGNTATAYRIGIATMANLFLSQLSSDSTKIIEEWADEMVGPERKLLFKRGLGTALYLTWDAYSDIMVNEGRSAEIYPLPSMRRPIVRLEAEENES